MNPTIPCSVAGASRVGKKSWRASRKRSRAAKKRGDVATATSPLVDSDQPSGLRSAEVLDRVVALSVVLLHHDLRHRGDAFDGGVDRRTGQHERSIEVRD